MKFTVVHNKYNVQIKDISCDDFYAHPINDCSLKSLLNNNNSIDNDDGGNDNGIYVKNGKKKRAEKEHQ